MVTNKGTETRLRGMKEKKMDIVHLSLVSVLLFVTVKAYFETSPLASSGRRKCQESYLNLATDLVGDTYRSKASLQ